MIKMFLLIMILVVPAESPRDYIKTVQNLDHYMTKEECMEAGKVESKKFEKWVMEKNSRFEGYASFGCMAVELPRSY